MSKVVVKSKLKKVVKPSDLELDKNDWIRSKWRPMMAWQYMITCSFDFIIFPILYAVAQAILDGHVSGQWKPITLEGAGLYHAAMGAVLGISAYGRSREHVVAMENFDFVDEDKDGIPDDQQIEIDTDEAETVAESNKKVKPRKSSRAG